MKVRITRKRLALACSCLGIALMGADLAITRNPFIHVGELMVPSLLLLVAGIALDRSPRNPVNRGKADPLSLDP